MKSIHINIFLAATQLAEYHATITGSAWRGIDLTSVRPGQYENELVGDEDVTKQIIWLGDLHKECLNLGLKGSSQTVTKLLMAYQQKDTKFHQIDTLFQELSGRLADEMQIGEYFSIDPDKYQYLEKNLFGEKVTDSFPSLSFDIEEAGKCLAFERWTASVFHLMRVMEAGLQVLGDKLKLPPTTNRSWDRILKKCDAELVKPLVQRSPEWASDDAFFSGATAMLRAVKDAWRNPTMHVGKVYTKEQAQDIWNTVKGFMRHLSVKLSEADV